MTDHRKALLLGLILIFVPFVWSQTSGDSVTFKGTVGETTLLSNSNLHIWVQNGNTGAEVCLGPAQFLKSEGFLPGIGDTVQVTGSRVGKRGVLRANTLQMGGKTLTLDHSNVGQSPPDCGGHSCAHQACGDHHGCNHWHHGHCYGHE